MGRHLNLLPPERRKNLRRGALLLASLRLVRILVVGMVVLSIGGALLIVGMWVMAITFSGLEDNELKNKVREYEELKEEISKQNQLLRLVNELDRERIVWSDFLEEYLDSIPPGTTVSSLTGDARVGIFEFSGTSLTRNSLVVFEERLNKLSWVQDVAAPRRNFLQKDNPEYTFEVRLEGFDETYSEESD